MNSNNTTAATRETNVAKYNRQVHYAVLPTTGDDKAFFTSVFQTSFHKLKKSKEPLVPVFASWSQRKTFYDYAYAKQSKYEGQLKQKSLTGPARKEAQKKFEAARHLVNVSWGGYFGTGIGSMARTTFEGSPHKNPRVYVFGHGSPGGDKLSGKTTIDDVANTLKSMNLPSTSDVRVNSCWSGAGIGLNKTSPKEVRERFLAGTLGEITSPDQSFAAKLHKRLQTDGFKGTTSGYLGGVAFASDKALTQRGEQTRAMTSTLAEGIDVRRSQVRFKFT